MAQNSSSHLPLKLLWQGALVIGLVLGAWAISGMLPGERAAMPAVQLPGTTSAVQILRLPKVGEGPSPLQVIGDQINKAEKEIVLAARQVTATGLLAALQARQAAGVQVTVLLSPEGTTDFARSRLADWMRQNKLTGVYRDLLGSLSHMIVIDGRYVVISDLPFSQRAWEPTDEAAMRAANMGFAYIIDDSRLASALTDALRARTLDKNRLL